MGDKDKENVNVLERLQKFQSALSPWILKPKFNGRSAHFQATVNGKKGNDQ